MVLVLPGDTNAHKKRLVGVNREVQFQMCFPLELCDSRFEVLKGEVNPIFFIPPLGQNWAN